MAKKTSEQWSTAQVMFEAGKSLGEINKVTTIDRSAISRTAKNKGWLKGVNQQLIADSVRIEEEKSTLNQQQLTFHDEEVSRQTEDAKMIRTLTNNNMDGVSKKLKNHDELSMLDHKNAQDLIDKASITLGVNQRHANGVTIQNTNAQQTVVKKGLSDFYSDT